MVEKESTRVTSAKPSSSPPLPPTRNPTKVKSFTREEIDRYWRMQRMIEEDHLLFAQKAAARIRAKSLKEEDHRRFEEFLKEILEKNGDEAKAAIGCGGRNKEPRIGIKDWWTKSKYAYLNQPAIKSMGERPTYIPQLTCFYSTPAVESLCATSFGVH
ncbi:uncharacterized protein LOC121974849 [Zingiber officinale]|uniref:uncharacterized protein LOC121969724 n=1 Tax=Zingiber officinale TaxID=94328 RepID=UPI001C4C61EC|nr:uncharacterized protein LOC121969724 [Zingiber officinale]XP_042382042.1 uncharacterized protein LOC121974849 [Zingiber officinale]